MGPRGNLCRAALLIVASAVLSLLVSSIIEGGASAGYAQTTPPDLTSTAIAGTSIPTGVAVTAASIASPTSTSQTCCWTVYDMPQRSGFSALKAIAGTSSNDVWAVGIANPGDSVEAITVHWDGTHWTDVQVPNFNGRDTRLYGVSVLAPNDVWAVGSVGDSLQKPQLTLALHWDGTRWTQVTSPNPTNNINELEAVAAVSVNDVWAVGYAEPSEHSIGGKQAIILHWDGQAWSQVATPAIPAFGQSTYTTLESLAVLSRDDIWAVGGGPNGFQPFALRWDGHEWKQAAMPDVKGLLHGVTALAPDDVWAVGNSYPANGPINTLTVHWDGKAWAVVPSAGTDGTYVLENWFDGVAALGKNDVWSVGHVDRHYTAPTTLVQRWDGQRWKAVSTPWESPGFTESSIDDIKNIGGELWMAGVHGSSVVLRYSSRAPSPTPTTPLDPPVPLPGNGGITFPETGKTLSGVFLQYWQTHGGLAQQGYPISSVMGEVSDLNGRIYTVQYFERAVFEYHPENVGTQYEVLLSQLGTFEYKSKYPNGAPGQKPNQDVGTVFFPQTGRGWVGLSIITGRRMGD